MMQETLFPASHKLLSPKYVQPVVDEYTTLIARYLEERMERYDGLNIALRDFIVPLTFDASSYAFFGKDCPVEDLFEPLRVFDNHFHLLLAGVPKTFMKGPVRALNEMVSTLERYLSKPGALDDASEMVKAYDWIAKDGGFVSHFARLRLRSDRLPSRVTKRPPHSLSASSGPSKRTPHLRRTGSLLLISNERTVSNPSSQRLTRP